MFYIKYYNTIVFLLAAQAAGTGGRLAQQAAGPLLQPKSELPQLITNAAGQILAIGTPSQVSFNHYWVQGGPGGFSSV